MRRNSAAAAFVAAALAARCLAATAAVEPPELRPQGAGLAVSLAAGVDSTSGTVRACLGLLDGGPLTLALRRAARSGRALRLVLDPGDPSTHSVGTGLLDLGLPGVRVRWLPGLASGRRLLILGGSAYRWDGASAAALTIPASAGSASFARDWRRARPARAGEDELREALRALPDPREDSPHYIPRAGGAP